ncbi:DUF5665 domain-containing protein [Tumebacillus permanentifrigoris]|uniref:Uncharacterized protein n=1 Tax=Tumebacillus permanentifrigoris TaxID=378543 RepID=A0A316D8Y5_9BACL|nr:DUF5665 domain-containing protein [Tumebacillus permanentifrigoris]PWK12870.1 hypothetical protein C7459_109232 [Tumebacillus permanentifrigoris]
MRKHEDEKQGDRKPGRPTERVRDDHATLPDETRFLSSQIQRLAVQMERANFAEYVQLMQRPRRLIFLNFVSGMSRGVGIALGFTIVAAVILYVLQKVAVLNLPIIGDFIADIVRIVDAQLHTSSY